VCVTHTTQDILDAWLRCQQGWLYLEPIFGSEDIQQQMPNEGRKFKAVDATWRRLMERLSKQAEVRGGCLLGGRPAAQSPRAVFVAGQLTQRCAPTQVLLVTADEELLKHLAEANKLLEQVSFFWPQRKCKVIRWLAMPKAVHAYARGAAR
jgi:dynein heavy chain